MEPGGGPCLQGKGVPRSRLRETDACIRQSREGMTVKRPEIPMTTGVRFLLAEKIPFTPLYYAFEEHGGTHRASAELGVDEHTVIKTLVFQTSERKPFLVLMHGDCEVSTKQLARTLEVRSVAPCDVATAQRLTGYTVGGISPFGTRNRLEVLAERTIFDLPEILINAGKRGFLVKVASADMDRALRPRRVDVRLPQAG